MERGLTTFSSHEGLSDRVSPSVGLPQALSCIERRYFSRWCIPSRSRDSNGVDERLDRLQFSRQ